MFYHNQCLQMVLSLVLMSVHDPTLVSMCVRFLAQVEATGVCIQAASIKVIHHTQYTHACVV